MSRILITGTSKGLGRATAAELTRRGHEVIATARNVETLRELEVAKKLPLDVTSQTSVTAAIAAAGPIDVLINNAAEIALGPAESIPLAEVQRLYEINVFGTWRMIQAVAPQLRAQKSGTIVNVSSVVGRMSFPLNAAYSSTKWAVEALSESLRLELGHFGVRVILVEPGQIGTGALDDPRKHFSENDPYLPLAAQLKRVPREQMTPPAVIANAIADAIEHGGSQFRFPAGKDAEALIGARLNQDDAKFDQTFRGALKIDW